MNSLKFTAFQDWNDIVKKNELFLFFVFFTALQNIRKYLKQKYLHHSFFQSTFMQLLHYVMYFLDMRKIYDILRNISKTVMN